MSEIQKVDKNFTVNSILRRENTKTWNVCQPPFRVYGLIKQENDKFRRMPENVAQKVNEGVYALHANTAGGRVRFVTNSAYMGLRAVMENITRVPHMPLTGTAGFDLYRTKDGRQEYLETFIPDMEKEDSFECERILLDPGMYEYTLNFPLYSDVREVYLVLDADAVVSAPGAYSNEKPVVFYGSSITQGGCASRPGNCYQNILSRRYNMDYVNLGFSGSARGEDIMAQYIAGLPMEVFVYDYDHNAPTPEHLRCTHERFYNIIRAAHPKLPIICMSKPFWRCAQDDERRQIILETLERARAKGDKNIYFVDGLQTVQELDAGDGIIVDGSHPNDLGFLCMANLLGRTLETLL